MDHRLPPLNALRAFEAVGRLSSVTHAANELCVTPGAVSRHIRMLEEHLGVELFVRAHRSISLTSVGTEYLAAVSTHMSGLRLATNHIRDHRKRKILKMRAPATIAVKWLIPRLASFHRAYPGIEVRLRTSGAPIDFAVEDLHGGIELGRGERKGVDALRLVDNEITPVCIPEIAEGKRLYASPSRLAQEILLHTLARPDDWSIWLGAAGINNIDLSRGMKYESSMLAFEAALQGHGVAIAQKVFVSKELREGKLVAPCDLSVDLGDYTYYFLSPSGETKRESEELRIFKRWIASVAQNDGSGLDPTSAPRLSGNTE